MLFPLIDSSQLYLALHDQIQCIGHFLLFYDLLGDGKGKWLGVVYDELELVGEEVLKQRTLAEHFYLF